MQLDFVARVLFFFLWRKAKDSSSREAITQKKEITQRTFIEKHTENTVELVSNLLSVISLADYYCVRAGQESLFSRYGAHNELCEARTMIYSTIPVIERLSGTKGTL